MAHKTFISYKHSEAQDLRNRIVAALGEDATYYQGETADSPDLTGTTVANIKRNLTDMMYGTTVTIVVVSPQMKQSKWIDWEIEYCLKEISRSGRSSKTNGVVGVVQEIGGRYDWLVTRTRNPDGCTARTIESSLLYPLINANRFNRKDAAVSCTSCQTHNQLSGSFISLVDEVDFLASPSTYIDNAFAKAENSEDWNLVKQRV